MAKPLVLTPNEKLLYEELSDYARLLKNPGYTDSSALIKDLSRKAHELHMSLKMHGHEPVYHGFILKNRGLLPDEAAFFNHIHPIEDLLAFIQNPDANDEEENLSAGAVFKFPVYNSRQRSYIRYAVIYAESGWMADYGERKRVELLEALSSAHISYPVTVGVMLEEIRAAAAEGAARKEIQGALNEISEWISKCERLKPAIKLTKME